MSQLDMHPSKVYYAKQYGPSRLFQLEMRKTKLKYGEKRSPNDKVEALDLEKAHDYRRECIRPGRLL